MLKTPEEQRKADTEEPISDILGRIVQDGRELVEAEADLIRAKAVSHVGQYRAPAIMLVLAMLFGIGAIITLCVAVALGLAVWIGPVAAGIVTCLLAGSVAWLLARAAIARMERIR